MTDTAEKSADLTTKQELALKQLSENVKDIQQSHWDDVYLLRWLRGRNFDVKKSENMLREHVEWRKRMDADHLLEWEPPEVLRLYYPGGYFGEDREGHPIWIDTMGTCDTKGLLYSATKKDMLKYKAALLEILYKRTFPELSKKHGRYIDKCTLIFDMEHYGRKLLWKPVVDVFVELMSMFADNYPEILKTAYFINAPKMFPVMWNIAKPFFDPDTIKKMKFLGKNWKKKLLEDIDPDELPEHWGGNCTDPDGDKFCRSKVCMGGKVPDKYRLKNVRENIDTTHFKQCTVPKKSSVQLDYDVSTPGSYLRWQFLSEGNDIGFGVYRRTTDTRQKKADMEEIVKSERFNSHMVPEEGSINVEEAGTYVLRFDNTYSWVKAKKIDYLIEVLPPDQHTQNIADTDQLVSDHISSAVVQ